MFKSPEIAESLFCVSAGLALGATAIAFGEVMRVPTDHTCVAIERLLDDVAQVTAFVTDVVVKLLSSAMVCTRQLVLWIILFIHKNIGCEPVSNSSELVVICSCIAVVCYVVAWRAYKKIR